MSVILRTRDYTHQPYVIGGGAIMNRRRRRQIKKQMKRLSPIVESFARDMAVRFLPAIGAFASDKLRDKGLSSVGDIVAKASVDGAQKLDKGDTRKRTDIEEQVSDLLANKASSIINKRLNQAQGSGSRIMGDGSRIMGSGSRILGGAFNSLETTRNI